MVEDQYFALRNISAVALEEVERAKETPETNKRGFEGISPGQIASLTMLVMSIPIVCVWLVLPFISKKN